MTDALHRPLLRYWVAKEDEDKGEDQGPGNDNTTNGKDPPPKLDRECSIIEPELAEFQSCQCPKINKGEGKSHLKRTRLERVLRTLSTERVAKAVETDLPSKCIACCSALFLCVSLYYFSVRCSEVVVWLTYTSDIPQSSGQSCIPPQM